jgi:hypothetical protein
MAWDSMDGDNIVQRGEEMGEEGRKKEKENGEGEPCVGKKRRKEKRKKKTVNPNPNLQRKVLFRLN